MYYTLTLRNTSDGDSRPAFEGLVTQPGHQPMEIRLAVSPFLGHRWAEVECSCGVIKRAAWETNSETYAALTRTAWESGCGTTSSLAEISP